MGKGGGQQPTAAPSPYETQLAKIAGEEYERARPLRDTYMNEFMSLMGYSPAVGSATGVTSPYQSSSSPSRAGASGKGARNESVWSNLDDPVATALANSSGGGNLISAMPSTAGGSAAGGYTYTGNAYDPKKSVMYAPIFNSLRTSAGVGEEQARNSILAGTPRGGGQTAALANLGYTAAKDRAGAQYQTVAQIIQDMQNKAYAVASGSPATAMQGYGAAGQLGAQNQMANLQSQQMQSANNSALGGGLGTAAGAGLGWAMAPATGGLSAVLPYLVGGSLLGGSAGKGIGGKK